MSVVINGTTGITNDGGYTGDGVVFADTTPANTLVTTTGGNVGVGTAIAPAKLTVGALGVFRVQTGSTTMDCTPTPGATDGFVWNTSASSYYDWAMSGSTKVRIDSSGNLLVGTTSSAIHNSTTKGFAYNNQSWLSITSQNESMLLTPQVAGGVVRFYLSNTGEKGNIAISSGAVAYNTTSDYRLKESISPMVGALVVVQQLKPVTYKWKADGSDGQGFIAHELAEVVPDCVTGEKDAVDAEGKPVYQGIDTSFLVATLTAAIQEQQAIILAQESALNALTARVAALDARLTSLEGTQP